MKTLFQIFYFKKEFKFLELIGGIFGFLIGLVQVLMAILLK